MNEPENMLITNAAGLPLPEPYQTLAKIRRYEVGGTGQHLLTCINWSETPEGDEFWAKVNNGLKPELPEQAESELKELAGMDICTDALDELHCSNYADIYAAVDIERYSVAGNREDLVEPYQTLARIRRSEQGNTAYNLAAVDCFHWGSTREERAFWAAVSLDKNPVLLPCSISALRAFNNLVCFKYLYEEDPGLISFCDGVVPEPYQTLAKIRRYEVGSANTLVEDCFVWSETPEGDEFWAKVNNGLCPKIPGPMGQICDVWTMKVEELVEDTMDLMSEDEILKLRTRLNRRKCPIKGINGELVEPYQTLACIRRAQYGDRSNEDILDPKCFFWGNTDEGTGFWGKVRLGEYTPIPEESLKLLSLVDPDLSLGGFAARRPPTASPGFVIPGVLEYTLSSVKEMSVAALACLGPDEAIADTSIRDKNGKSLIEPYQAKAQIYRAKKGGSSNTLGDGDCFDWSSTDEGVNYWFDVAQGLKA